MDWKDGKHLKLCKRGCKQRGDFRMRTPKYYICLTDDEYRLAMQSLLSLKNRFIREGRFTDGVDDVIIKLSKAKKKKIRTA